jgi:uncharacterized membrane protein
MARPRRGPPLAVWAASAAFAAVFGALSVLRQRAFSTGRFDLGNMVQAVWSTAHGHPLQVTGLNGHQMLRLGSHVDPVLMLFAPLWRLWPSPDLLLVAQSLAIALGAFPVYRLAREHVGSPEAGIAFALVYLLYPATQWLALNEFHPGALAVPALLFAFRYLDDDRLWPFALFAALAAACREDIPLVIAAFGLWYAFARRELRVGLAIAIAGVAWTAIATAVVIPHFRGGESTAFLGRYSEARASAHDPFALARMAFDHRGLKYVLDLVLPLAGLCLFAAVSLVALPTLALNLLSATPTQTSIHFHYTAGAIPPLVIGAVFGAARLRNRMRVPVAALAVAAALIGNYALGAIPAWHEFPGGENLQAHAATTTPHDRIAARALALIPPHAVVSASNTLGAHLSARRRILSFPFIEDATWVAVDETRPWYGDRLAPLPYEAQVVWLRRNPAWRVVFDRDGVVVFRRVLPP